MTMARRGLLRLLGTAPAAVPFAKTAFASVLAQAEPIMAVAGVLGSVSGQLPQLPDSPGRKLLGPILFDQLHRLRQQHESEKGSRYNLREAGIEHDIAALRSTSRSYKALKQIARDRDDNSLSARAEKILWG